MTAERGATYRSLLDEAVELFENDDECNKVGTDAWSWRLRASEALLSEIGDNDNGRRGREPVNGETAKADWMKAGTGDYSPASPQRADAQATAAAGSNPAAALPSSLPSAARITVPPHHPSCKESDQSLVWECSQCGTTEHAALPSSARLTRDDIIERVEGYFKRVRKLGGDTGECSAAGVADWLLWTEGQGNADSIQKQLAYAWLRLHAPQSQYVQFPPEEPGGDPHAS